MFAASDAGCSRSVVFEAAQELIRNAEICWYFDLYLFLTSGHNTASIELPRGITIEAHVSRCLLSARRSRKTRSTDEARSA